MMALSILKRLFWPGSGSYQHLRQAAYPDSMECGQLNDHVAANDGDEKYEKPNRQSNTIRINPRIISDATIGLSDGLTVPFALTAGLSALGDTNVVLYGGLAELIAGSISMGLGGYLGAKSEAEAYLSTLAATRRMAFSERDLAIATARSTFGGVMLGQQTIDRVAADLLENPESLVEFLMRFHHQLAESNFTPARAYSSAVTISLGYVFGGLVPLLPYLLFRDLQHAFVASVLVMGFALFAFGWLKTSLLGEGNTSACARNGVQMMVCGGVAAAAAMTCVTAVGS